MSPDPYRSSHMYLRILCKIHVSGSMYRTHVLASTKMDPLQDLCLRIHVSASICISGISARSMSPDPYISIHMNLRNRCEIHVSGSVFKHPYVSQDPLRDPCLWIHVSASKYISGISARFLSPDPYISIHMYLMQDPCLSIHGSVSICISGTSARSMSPDPYIRIHMYLRNRCKIHVSGSVYKHPYVSQAPLQDPCLRIHVSDPCLSIFISQELLQDPCLRIRI